MGIIHLNNNCSHCNKIISNPLQMIITRKKEGYICKICQRRIYKNKR